jgi:hypothetical protein
VVKLSNIYKCRVIDIPVHSRRLFGSKGDEWTAAKRLGIDMKDDLQSTISKARQRLPIFSVDSRYPAQALAHIAAMPIPSAPCAMVVEDEEQLLTHATAIYDLAVAHYIIGKQEMSAFPYGCCLQSTANLFVNAVDAGYLNAISAWSEQGGHAYFILPFLMQEKPGVLIADPTALQLAEEGDMQAPLITVDVRYGLEWNYSCPTWWYKRNLFPSRIAYSALLHEKIREATENIDAHIYSTDHDPTKVPLAHAYLTPVTVSIRNH